MRKPASAINAESRPPLLLILHLRHWYVPILRLFATRCVSLRCLLAHSCGLLIADERSDSITRTQVQ